MDGIFALIMVFMSGMGDEGWTCTVKTVKTNTAIVECTNGHEGVKNLLDSRNGSSMLIGNYRVM